MKKIDLNIICKDINWNFYRDKTVLITGVTGRLGRWFMDTLMAVNLEYDLHLRVIGAARSAEKAREIFEGLQGMPGVSFLIQDINTPLLYDGTIDYIFHAAGPAAPMDFRDSPVTTLWTHVNGTHQILECARTHETKRVFYVSTVEIYGECEDKRKIRETDMGVLQHLNARACYPEAKRLCETMLASYREEYRVDYCGMRCTHTIGPGIKLDDGRAFAEFIWCALNGTDIILHSDGGTERMYTYTADVIHAAFLIMEKGDSMLYNVAAEENLVCVRDLAELIAGMSPSGKTKVRFSPEATNLPYLPFRLAAMDTSEIRKLGWKPQVDLESVFRWTIDAIKISGN